MTGRKREESKPKRRADVEVVRFDSKRMESGLYRHRQTKVVLPVKEPEDETNQDEQRP